MGNKHVNGKDPYVMSVSEAQKEIDGWCDNGGQVRIDGPHPGKNDEVHAHLSCDDNPNEDLLIQIVPTEEELESYKEETTEVENDDQKDNDDD